MSWRGSTGHIDANVPDYQKMLQTRYPSSGWSSTQPGYSGYTGRSGLGGYLNPHRTSPSYGKSSQGYGSTYQPSKYGHAADSLYNSALDSRGGQLSEDAMYRSDNGYLDKNYAYLRKESEHEPFKRDYSSDTSQGRGHTYSSDTGQSQRGPTRRMTDYSSDSGHAANHTSSYRTGYGSDSGAGRGHALDYGSDSGGLHLRHRRKSSEFELDIPSPDRSMLKKDDVDAFTSPVQSQIPMSEYYRYTNNHSPFSENQNRQESLAEYLRENHSQDINNDSKNTETDVEDESTLQQQTNGESEEEERLRMNFMSPPLYRGSLEDMTLVHKEVNPVKGKAGNLTNWQQNQISHSSDNHHGSHSYKTHHRHSPDSFQRHTKEKYHHGSKLTQQSDHRNISPAKSQSSSEQINHIRNAADAIIRDKDAIIDELRSQVVTMEEAVKEYENKLRRTLMTRGASSGEAASFSKMQDLEFRNSELRAELAKLKLTKDTEIEELEIKLGGVEHEVVQLKTALRKSQPNAAGMKEKMEEKQQEIEEWQTKYTSLNRSYDDMKEKIDGLERYLSDLPTIEEFNKTSTELSKCQEESHLKTEQIGDLGERLKETTEQLSDRETTIQDLRGRQQQLASKLHEMSTELKRIKSEGEGKALSHALDELSETKEIKERLALDLEKAKKLLEMNHRRLRQLEVKHQTEKQQIQERLVQEEESGTAHREELRMKEEQIAKLKRSIKDFAGRNQDLMDEGLILKEQIKQFEQMSTDENQRLQRKFVREMGICFAELQSLVQICIQRAEGKDPNISLLLGMRTSNSDEDEGAVGGAKREEHSLKHWFKKLKELHAEVEKVRKMICNKCAEEMGDNLNCATQ